MDKLTKKQQGFVKDYVETGNGVQSALNNYDTEDYGTANQIAIENLQKPIIQNAIKSIADRIPDDKLHEVLMEGLQAGKTVYKNNNATKEVEEVGYEADYAVRHKYLDTALKLKGAYETDEQKNVNILMPVLVKFLNNKDERSDNGDTQ